MAHRKRRKKERTKYHKDTKKCDILKEKRERNTMKMQKVWNTKREERKGEKRGSRDEERETERKIHFLVWCGLRQRKDKMEDRKRVKYNREETELERKEIK